MKNNFTSYGKIIPVQKLVLCLVFLFSAQFISAQVPTVQQQLYVTFGASTMLDLSPNGFTITPTGAPIPCPDRFGNPNCALKLAPTDYLTITPDPVFDMVPGEDYSISMWYRGYTASISDLELLFNKTSSTNAPIPSDYHLCIYDLNKPYQGYFFSPVTFQPITPGAGWHHLVAMYNNVGSVWTLYIDNVLAYNFSGPVVTSSPGDPVKIGGGWPIGTGYNGRVDDIVFYDRLLTVPEINQLFIDANSCAIPCGCPTPTGLAFAGCTNPNTSVLTWAGNPCALSYQVRIRNVTAAGPWVNYTSATPTISIPTIPGNVYQWKVRSQCAATGIIVNSPFSSNNNFTALACRTGEEEFETEISGSTELYPNPATNAITITLTFQNATLTFYDLSGKIVMEKIVPDYVAELSIEHLQNGIYLLKIENGSSSEILKFVKTE